MASNRVPDAQGVRVRLADSETQGLKNFGASVGLSVVTEAKMQFAIDDFLAHKQGAATLDTARGQKQSALNAAINDGYALAGIVKRFVTDLPGFGTEPNAQWQELGFAAGSLEIIRKTVEVMLAAMSSYFASHTGDQSPPRGITSVNLDAKRDAILAARGDLARAKMAYSAQKTEEDTAFKNLGKLMSDLVKELKLHLSGDDATWYAFGLRRPDDPETPGAPHNLSLSSAGSGRVFADWDDVPGAERYHVWLAQGAEKAVRVETVEDSEYMLQNLIVGTQVTVYIVSSNDGGESVPSESVSFTVV